MVPNGQVKDQIKLFKNREDYIHRCNEMQEIDKHRLKIFKEIQDDNERNNIRKQYTSKFKFRTLSSYDFEVKFLHKIFFS